MCSSKQLLKLKKENLIKLIVVIIIVNKKPTLTKYFLAICLQKDGQCMCINYLLIAQRCFSNFLLHCLDIIFHTHVLTSLLICLLHLHSHIDNH